MVLLLPFSEVSIILEVLWERAMGSLLLLLPFRNVYVKLHSKHFDYLAILFIRGPIFKIWKRLEQSHRNV